MTSKSSKTSQTPDIEICTIGEELLCGDRVDTNSSEIQAMLLRSGLRTRRCTVVGDEIDAIAVIVREGARRAAAFIVTGGLGPTEDDVTREALAVAANAPLEEDPAALAGLEAFFRKVGRPILPGNRRQALIPRGAEVMPNPVGTAPGFVIKIGKCWVFCLPGVPSEMRAMMTDCVRPRLEVFFPDVPRVVRHSVHLVGVPESVVNQRLLALMESSADLQVGMTAHQGVVTIKLTSFAPDPVGRAAVDAGTRYVRREFGDRVLGEGEGFSLAQAVVELLIERNITLATAESCTGGLVGFLVTQVPGASRIYLEGAVTYASEAKVRTLGVPRELLAAHGEVSAEVAQAMAQGAAERAGCRAAVVGCRAAVAITGIAGPGGGTPEKPVGLVYIAAHLDGRTVHRRLQLVGGREVVRRRSAMAALDLLRRMVLGVDES